MNITKKMDIGLKCCLHTPLFFFNLLSATPSGFENRTPKVSKLLQDFQIREESSTQKQNPIFNHENIRLSKMLSITTGKAGKQCRTKPL